MKTLARVLCSLALSVSLCACLNDPKLQADTEENFRKSFSSITAPMSEPDRQKFDAALRDIAMVQAGFYGPRFSAETYELPTDKDNRTSLSRTLASGMQNAIAKQALSAWPEIRAKSIVSSAKNIVDGRTVSEILTIAVSERKKALEQSRTLYQSHKDKALSKIAEIDEKITRIDSGNEKGIVENIIISNAKFWLDKDSFLTKPIISLNISNKSESPIKKIFVSATLQSPERAIPWLEDDFNYQFSGGLEPGELKRLDLAPNMFSSWGKLPDEAARKGVLTLRLNSVEDASGARIESIEGALKTARKEKGELMSAVSDIDSKIEEINKSIQAL